MTTTNSVFRERVEPSSKPEPVPEKPAEVKGVVEGNTDIPVARDAESDRLDIWELEKNHKYGHDYFNIRAIAHTFPVKAHFGAIDKFVRSEMSEREMELTTKNYESILQEIENEIGTTQTQTYKRLQKIFGYIQAVKRLRDAKAKKEAFKKLYTTD